MIGIDTNVLLRWLIDERIWPEDNPGQTEAAAELLSGAGTVYVNAVVLAETMWVLGNPMKQPRAVLVTILDRLLISANVEVENRPAVRAVSLSLRQHAADVHDRLIAEFNRSAGCSTTYTFDRKAARTPGFSLLEGRA